MKRKLVDPNIFIMSKSKEQILTNFWTRRLIEEADNPQIIWSICKDENNCVKISEAQLEATLEELKKRVARGEVEQAVLDKINDALLEF